MAVCRACGRRLAGDDGYFELCSDHDLECLAAAPEHVEVADIALVVLHWATRRAMKEIVGGLGDS